MPDELPPLDKFVVSGYAEGDPAYPIVIVVKDSRVGGYTAPTMLTACPDSRFSTHIFLGTTPTNIDNRVIWTYEILPGPSLTSIRYDVPSNTNITTIRTKKLLSAITEGVTEEGSGATATMTVTESEQISALVGIEVVTIYPRGDHYSEATAIPSTEFLPFQFPATADIQAVVESSGLVGTSRSFIRRVPHYKKTWWEISETEPTLTLNGLIDYGVAPGLFGDDPLGEVVYDATADLDYESLLYDLPGSVPDLTEYIATWVDGDPRSVLGKVVQDGGKFRYRIEKVFVVFRMPRLPTLNP